MWKCIAPFTGYPAEDAKRYLPGDIIPDDEADAMGLDGKPDIAIKEEAVVSENP